MKASGRLLLLGSLLMVAACSRPTVDHVAMVGQEPITIAEFQARYSFTAYIFSGEDQISNKHTFLQSLIWEKRLAQEAKKLGLDQRPFYQQQMQQLRKEALWEAYYQRHLLSAADPDQALAQTIRRIMADKTLHLSRETFTELVAALQLVLGKPALIGADSVRRVSERDVAAFSTRYEALMKKPLASFSNGDLWTTADFLQRLATGPYPLPFPQSTAFLPALKQAVRRAAELEYISQAALAEGLDTSDYVRSQMQMWSAALLTQTLMQEMAGHVHITEQDIDTHYNLHHDHYQNDTVHMPLDSVRTQISRQLHQEKTIDEYRQRLSGLTTPATVYESVLDTLQVKQSADVVLKQHFPGRVLAPVLFPYADIMPPTP